MKRYVVAATMRVSEFKKGEYYLQSMTTVTESEDFAYQFNSLKELAKPFSNETIASAVIQTIRGMEEEVKHDFYEYLIDLRVEEVEVVGIINN